MNVKFASSLVAATLVAAVAGAVPTITFNKIIDVGGTITSPHGIAAVNNELFIAGFANRDIGKIADPLGTPVITEIVADGIGGVTWPASRGPQVIEVNASNQLVVIGDNGTNGYAMIYDTAGVQQGTTIEYTGLRVCSGTFFGSDPDLVAGRSNSGTVIDLPLATAAAAESSGPAPATGFAAPLRDFVVVGNDFFCLTVPGVGAATYNISKYSGGTPGDMAGYTQTQFATMSAGVVVANHLGMSTFTDTGDSNKVYIVTCDLGAASPAIKLFDASGGAATPATVTFTDAELTTGVRGLEVVTIGGQQYIAVTRITGTPANTVILYDIDPTAVVSGVTDWEVYTD